MNGAPLAPIGQVHAPRPSQDMQNIIGGQGPHDGENHNHHRNEHDDENANPRTTYNATASVNRRSARGGPESRGRTALKGSRNGTMNGYEERPRYNPINPTRPQSATLVNVNDPIQVHLLVETALGDSREFEILSPEEVDALKKQCQTLTQRIEQTRQNLAIQSKYRDAAISMAKLYSPSERDKKRSVGGQRDRRGMFAHNRNSSDSVREADQERIASEKKCEDLAAELLALEKRVTEAQTKLLKHTAGILQMTHKGPNKTPMGQAGTQQQGIPGSPESMYTSSNARDSFEPFGDELFFDERSLYRPADRLDVLDNVGQESFLPQSQGPSQEQMQIIANTEQKLEDLNSRLREVIIRVNPGREATYSTPTRDEKYTDAGATLQSHLDYLEKSIMTIDQENGAQTSRAQQQSEAAAEKTLKELNGRVRNLLLAYDPNRPEPPQLTGNGPNEQLRYFREGLGAVEAELSRSSSAATKNMATQGTLEQMEAVMKGLWDTIQSGERDQRQRKADRRKARSLQNLPEDDDDSPDEDGDQNEKFSLQAFSTKFQQLHSQSSRLKDQKKVLQRQIKQQRELNSKSDASKDAQMVQKVEELQRTQNLLTRTEADADSVRQQLSDMMEKLDEANQRELMRDQARSNSESAAVRQAQEELKGRNQKLQRVEEDLSLSTKKIRQVEEELDRRNQKIATLEKDLQDMKNDQSIRNAELQGKMTDSESRIASLTQELAAVGAAQSTFEKQLQEKQKAINDKEKEMEDMNMEIATLRTEVTIARAELDGAYGSRAQRAAEVAVNPAIQKEIDTLLQTNLALTAEVAALREKGTGDPATEATLKKELAETIEEFEVMIKASIEWEKERESLEGMVDKLRDEREALDEQLSDEKVRWMGMKSPGLEGGMAPANTSTTVLRDEFKKMMRDTRAEHVRVLRVCLLLFVPPNKQNGAASKTSCVL
ncbi:hypothetical protein JHW43_007453 [Diplocarpon mali]|nr:hypothetical protein JHW43_007453 [Diplocarpon mali]